MNIEEKADRILHACGVFLVILGIGIAVGGILSASNDIAEIHRIEVETRPKHCTPIISTVPIGTNSSVTRITYICH